MDGDDAHVVRSRGQNAIVIDPAAFLGIDIGESVRLAAIGQLALVAAGEEGRALGTAVVEERAHAELVRLAIPRVAAALPAGNVAVNASAALGYAVGRGGTEGQTSVWALDSRDLAGGGDSSGHEGRDGAGEAHLVR